MTKKLNYRQQQERDSEVRQLVLQYLAQHEFSRAKIIAKRVGFSRKEVQRILGQLFEQRVIARSEDGDGFYYDVLPEGAGSFSVDFQIKNG